MSTIPGSRTLVFATAVLCVAFLAADAIARGGGGRGGGGGGFSRGGPAAGGGFASRGPAGGGARAASRQAGAVERTDRTQTRVDARRDVAEDWDDNRGCCWGADNRWGYAVAGAAVGTAVGYAASRGAEPDYVMVLPCTPTVVTVSGTSYYRCGSTWYNRNYVGGDLNYVVVNAPPGY